MNLVTGGTGIVGAHVLLELLRAGDSVRALYREGSDRSIVQRIFRHYGHRELSDRIEWIEGDVMDVSALADAMHGVDRVYHAAALVSFDPRKGDAMLRSNVQGTANVVNAALEAGVKRLCHVSSTAAIGTPAPGIMGDEALPWSDHKRVSDYSRSKHWAELEVQRGIAEGLEAVIVNPSVVIGPGQWGRSSMTIVDRLRKGTRWYTAGTNAFVDARDVAACMITLMDKGITGERYLLVGENAGYKRLFELLASAFGHPLPRKEVRPWMLDLAWRAERLRGWLTGASPMVTKATAASSLNKRAYSNAKVKALLGHQFRTLEESVANVVSFAVAG
ncbi:MAG TPA: NAD-dependent epimerase/dehydratase family protein [Flavobacteriales bacterium]|nr:NAD-dependent epimerase/dehydratase family protein [Flavobacteriales bacterium]